MDTISGDKFILDCARFIRYNEAKLGHALKPSRGKSLSVTTNTFNPTAWLWSGVATEQKSQASNNASRDRQRSIATESPSASGAPPSPLPITVHHLYYILLRCEGMGLSVGPLDVHVPTKARPPTSFTFVPSSAFSNSEQNRHDLDETMSINSLQSAMLKLGLKSGSTKTVYGIDNSWWTSRRPVDLQEDLKFIFAALTRISALRLTSAPMRLIEGFEDCPGENSTPLDTFKSVQVLEIHDNDPRAYIGWDRLSMQLRSLTLRRTGTEDVRDIVIDAVLRDLHRREKSQDPSQAGSDPRPELSMESTCTDHGEGKNILPALSWYFLRHLSLADNSLTFLHPDPVAHIGGLTSLDLSGNLLNAVPPCLDALQNLQFLNVSNNLIDSVLGIPLCIPHVRALNLSYNRIESLCGLERLLRLRRIDLRHNEVYDIGEVGRLATLDGVHEIHIAGNPVMEEDGDPRTAVFIEFAREGHDIDVLQIDGQGIGFFEKRKVSDAVPNSSSLRCRRRAQRPDSALSSQQASLRGSEVEDQHVEGVLHDSREEAAILRNANVPTIKNVHHKSHFVSRKGDIRAQSRGSMSEALDGARRNRRVVEFDKDPRSDLPKLSDSNIVKQAALSGDLDVALGDRLHVTQPATSRKVDSIEDGAKEANSRIFDNNSTGPQDFDRLPAIQRLETDRSSSKSQLDSREAQELQGLRRKIEALKGEVGDDWMRLLTRGESSS